MQQLGSFTLISYRYTHYSAQLIREAMLIAWQTPGRLILSVTEKYNMKQNSSKCGGKHLFGRAIGPLYLCSYGLIIIIIIIIIIHNQLHFRCTVKRNSTSNVCARTLLQQSAYTSASLPSPDWQRACNFHYQARLVTTGARAHRLQGRPM